MPQLDNYLVSLGLKGQNAVLSTMEKIRKKSSDLTKKKKTVTLSTKFAAEKPAAKKEVESAGGMAPKAEPGKKPKTAAPGEKPKPRPILGEKPGETPTVPNERNNKKFSKAVDNFHSGVKDFSSSAATLDPAATISSVTSALGTSLSGLSFATLSLGRLPEGIAHMANAALSMAKNSVDMAKQATAAFHGLATRNAAAEHYGGMVKGQDQLSRNERAMFIDTVSNSMGRIQKPLADEINKLISTKDTRALARVGAGDWESTGTDKGWMLGQMSNSFQGLPPTVRQKLQVELLKNYSGEIQNMKPDSAQAKAQRNAAAFTNLEEDQTEKVASRNVEGALTMTKTFNDLQLKMFDGGLKLVKTVNTIADTFDTLVNTVPKVTTGLNNLVNLLKDPSFTNAVKVLKTYSGGTPRAGK